MTDEEKKAFDAAKAELEAAKAQIEELKKGADPKAKAELEAALAKVKQLEEDLTKAKSKGEIKGASEDSVHALLEVTKTFNEKLDKLRPARPARRWLGV